jgi:hypothetical protein
MSKNKSLDRLIQETELAFDPPPAVSKPAHSLLNMISWDDNPRPEEAELSKLAKVILGGIRHGEVQISDYEEFQEDANWEIDHHHHHLRHEYSAQEIRRAIMDAWEVAKQDAGHNGDSEPSALESGMSEQESQLSDLAREVADVLYVHKDEIDSVDELYDTYQRETAWAAEYEPEELRQAVNDAWAYVHG